MEIFDLNNIKKVTQKPDKELGQTEFYDLTETTFKSRFDIPYSFYYVQKEEEMRLDLICSLLFLLFGASDLCCCCCLVQIITGNKKACF